MKQRNLFGRAGKWLCGAAFVLSVAVVGLLGALNLVATAVVDAREVVAYHFISPLSLVAFALLAAALYLFVRFGKGIPTGWLFAAFAGAYLIVGTVLIFSVSSAIRADAELIHKTAIKMLAGWYSEFAEGGYLYRYPHQLGMVLYEALLGKITVNTRLLFMVNLMLVIATNWLLFRVTMRLWPDEPLVARLTVVLSFAFLAPLFFILFAYGLIPGCAAMCGGLYLLLCFVQEERWYTLVGGAFLLALASFLKKNFAVGIVAALICLALWLLQKPSARRVLACLFVAAVCVLFRPAANMVFTAATGVPVSEGLPSVLWVAMGTDPDNEARAPGWYNNYIEDVYWGNDGDLNASSEAGREKLRDSLTRYAEEPTLAIRFFGKKLLSIWCEPTFQSIWSGPLAWCGQTANTRMTRSIYDMGTGYWGLYHGMKATLLLVLLGALAGLLLERRRPERWLFPCVYLMGGVLLHLAWEGKSQYVYPYVLLLIPLSARALASLAQKMKKA